jgi:hypothetical protein
MDKLEHFLKKNHHKALSYFTTKNDILVYVMVLSLFDGIIYIIDLNDGDIPYINSGITKRFYVEELNTSDIPVCIHDQPIDSLIRNKELLKESLKVLQTKNIDGNLLILGSNYCIEVLSNDYKLFSLTDFPETLEQHGVFQKYDLEYFYNHKNTISQNVKQVYTKLHQNFLTNLEQVKIQWEIFSKDPSQQLAGIQVLLQQYLERSNQREELKKLVISMYQTWKQISNEYDMLEIHEEPISFDQNLQLNQKKQLLYRKLDRIKLIEKHAIDLLVKIHISCTCLLFYIHLLLCEMGLIHFRINRSVVLQSQIQKFISTTNSISSLLDSY